LFLLVAQIEWIFIVPLIGLQMNKGDTWSTSSVLTCQKVLWRGLREPKCDDSGLWNIRSCKNTTTFLAFYNFLHWAISCYLWRNCLITTPTPSLGPFPWLLQKKLHNILQPPIIFGYQDTKHHGLLLLNWDAHPSLISKPNAIEEHILAPPYSPNEA
jgi:hypothetical protein